MDLTDAAQGGKPALLGLLRRIAGADSLDELAFIAVNETHALAPYRQAALWVTGSGIAALSGVVAAEANAPYTDFLRRVFRRLEGQDVPASAQVLRGESLGEELAAEWGAWLPSQGLLLPLPSRGDWAGGLLLLARDEPWSPLDLQPLGDLSQQLSLAYAAKQRSGGFVLPGKRGSAAPAAETGFAARLRGLPRALWVSLGLLMLAFLPVRLSVLAPAEVVPERPTVMRSPLDGVVERVLVEPNQRVVAGDALFEFDRAAIISRQQVAERTLDTLEAEYRQRAQLAVGDSESRAALAVIAGRIEEQRAELVYLNELASRGRVLAPEAGVVIFDDPSEWAGRPVVTGERVMMLAREADAEIEAWLAPGDLIPLQDGATLSLYLNADPLQSLQARTRYIAYEASERPDGGFAYRVRASLADDSGGARIGMKGTAKLSGERVPLWYWLLRKPLAGLRGWLGW